MRLLYPLLFLALVFDASAQQPALWGDLEPGPHAVGFRVAFEYDHSRTYRSPFNAAGAAQPNARPMQVFLWYPAYRQAAPVYMPYRAYVHYLTSIEDFNARATTDQWASEQLYDPEAFADPEMNARLQQLFDRTTTAIAGAPPAAGSFPVILYVAGGNGTAYENSVIAEYLASHGYIVAALPSYSLRVTSKAGKDFDLKGVRAQARDLDFLFQYMRTVPNADVGRLGTVSTSWGGIADFLFAIHNANVRAVINLDGGVGFLDLSQVFEDPALDSARMRAAFMHMVSEPTWTNDGVFNSAFFDSLKLADAYLLKYKGMAHSDFSSNSLLRRMSLREEGTDWTKQITGYEAVGRNTLDFLNAYVKGEDTGLAFVEQGLGENEMFILQTRKAVQPALLSEGDFVALLLEQGADAGRSVYTATRALFPDYAPMTRGTGLNLGWHLFAYVRHDDALAVFELSAELYPDNVWVLINLAEAHRLAGHVSDAIRVYESALALNPESASVHAVLEALRNK